MDKFELDDSIHKMQEEQVDIILKTVKPNFRQLLIAFQKPNFKILEKVYNSIDHLHFSVADISISQMLDNITFKLSYNISDDLTKKCGAKNLNFFFSKFGDRDIFNKKNISTLVDYWDFYFA